MNAIKKIVMGLAVASAAAFTPTAAVANVSVTGADEILTVGEDTVYVFSTVGTEGKSITFGSEATADILVVGGGGAGGSVNGGGGGGGGVVYLQDQVLAAGAYAIAVGAGGAKPTDYKGNNVNCRGGNGGDSSFGDWIGKGGGGGGYYSNGAGNAGGCGGGGNGSGAGGASNQDSYDGAGHGTAGVKSGNASYGGGGGGAGGAGSGKNGGDGYLCSITGEDVYYGAGGGAGQGSNGTATVAPGGQGGGGTGGQSKIGVTMATDGTGYGAGGGGGNGAQTTSSYGGAGYQGIVIVRAKGIAPADAVVAEVLSVDVTYDGAEHEAGLKVVFPENYEENWTWSDGTDGYANPEVFVEPGTYTNGVTVSADGLKPFVGTAEIKIRPIDLATQVTVDTIPACQPGAEYKPTPRVWVTETGDELKAEDGDIAYEYPDSDYTSVGVHTVRIVGKRHAAGVAETRFFIFAGVFNVATNGDDVAGSGTAESPFRTIAKAVACATEAFKLGWDSAQPVRILLAAGTYEEHDLVLSNACQIVGQGATRDDVVIDAQAQGRVFRITAQGASLENLTIRNGKATAAVSNSRTGGGVYMVHGTVTNCVFRNCGTEKTNGYGGMVYMGGSDSLLVDCYFTGSVSYATQYNHGFVIFADAGRIVRCTVKDASHDTATQNSTAIFLMGTAVIENSLVTGVSGKGNPGAAITLDSSANTRVVNCTVVGNSGGTQAGIYSAMAGQKVVNCVIYGNGGTAAKEWGNANGANFVNCAFAEGITVPSASCIDTVTDDAFKGYAAGDYRLASDSVLKGAGTTWDVYHNTYGATSPTDLIGTLWGKTLDIGCYAAKAAGLMLILR